MKPGGDFWQRFMRAFRPDPLEEVDDELQFHVERLTRRYEDAGMDPTDARRAALERIGDLGPVREECARLLSSERRGEEHRRRLNVSWLDVELGVRMLVKYPGLSLVSVTGMAMAVAIGSASFAAVDMFLDPALPLPGGDRIVVLENTRLDRPGSPDRRILTDFLVWRDELESVRDLGAYRIDSRNLITSDSETTMVSIAEMSAAGFRVADVAPLLGRPLTEGDERLGAPPVVVIGYREWQGRFDADPSIIGGTIRLGTLGHTVVGVMPEGFRFPIFHGYWTPLRLEPADYEPGRGPAIEVFGRLADGATLERAQAELTTIGRSLSAALPDRSEYIRPRVLPLPYSYLGIDSPLMQWMYQMFKVVVTLLLVLVAANVAILVYARTATRAGEIVVRSALGASRPRVVTQLFVEALVLSVAAAALGLAVAGVSLGWIDSFLRDFLDQMPFWMDFHLSAEAVVYVLLVAVLGAAIVGIVPALQATGRNVQVGLQQLSTRGSRMQLGRTWTVLIVAQVAIAVATLPGAVYYATESFRQATYDPGYAETEFLSGTLALARDEAPPTDELEAARREFETRWAETSIALLDRLDSEPGIDATFTGPSSAGTVEVDPGGRRATPAAPEGTGGSSRGWVRQVASDYFDVFRVPVEAGRGLLPGDAGPGSPAVLASRTFVERFFGNENAVGRRVRVSRAASPEVAEPWLEIVGVVPDFPPVSAFADSPPRLYRPIRPDVTEGSLDLAVRVREGPASAFVGRLREIAVSVDPDLQIHELRVDAEFRREQARAWRMVALAIAAVTSSVLLLSAAGIHAMLAFTVARRRREIGIRTALGADSRRILGGVFARAGKQLLAGMVAGLALAFLLDRATGGFVMGSGWNNESGAAPWYRDPALSLFPAVAAVFLAVGLLAALQPARRGLAVEPTQALREE